MRKIIRSGIDWRQRLGLNVRINWPCKANIESKAYNANMRLANGIDRVPSEVIKMDNDILIDQARQLYAKLLFKEISLSMASDFAPERIDRLIVCAYLRYLRRLNRCVLCYRHRRYDCIREPGEKAIPCSRRLSKDEHTEYSPPFTGLRHGQNVSLPQSHR